jgi:hypothetical protein
MAYLKYTVCLRQQPQIAVQSKISKNLILDRRNLTLVTISRQLTEHLNTGLLANTNRQFTKYCLNSKNYG